MSTLKTTNLQHASAASPSIVLASDGSATAQLSSINDGPLAGTRNRIINGDMRIDQRNAGASVTPTNDSSYTLDRWKSRYAGAGSGRFSVQQSITSAVGFPVSALLSVTTTSAPSGTEFYGFVQDIEGFNTSDLAWGTADAQEITLSFWARSSLVGTYCYSIRNWTGTMSYVAEFTIDAADTFEYKQITIPGPTTGAWETTTNPGLLAQLCLGCGATRQGTADSWQATNIVATSNQVDWINTSGATFYLTGVQLEAGNIATPFERRSYGQELALCQRYFSKSFLQGTAPAQNVGTTAGALVYTTQTTNTQYITAGTNLPVTMRAAPTITTYNPFAANTGWSASGAGNYTASVYSYGDSSIIIRNDTTVSTAGSNMSLHWTASAEL